jgi:5,10-methylenetetrahydromethanopterin reductase
MPRADRSGMLRAADRQGRTWDMSLQISCSFATSLETPEHIVIAERLGYRRAWCYDSPALYPDVWVTLARAADRTSRIELGPGVLVPNLRHVLTNASAVATLVALAPGRVVVGVGAGLTARLALGLRPLPWREVAAYTQALRALLRGEQVEWDGAVIGMGHPLGFAPPRPIEVPILVAAQGPKGLAVAREVGDGIITIGPKGGFPWVAELLWGTLLEAGEEPGSERVMAAVGSSAAIFYHATYHGRGWGDVDSLPGGGEWRRRAEALPERTRHLAVWANHLIGLNDLDPGIVTGEVVGALGLAMDAAGWRARLAASEQAGVTEIIYQPGGPDIERELTDFARVAGLAGVTA